MFFFNKPRKRLIVNMCEAIFFFVVHLPEYNDAELRPEIIEEEACVRKALLSCRKEERIHLRERAYSFFLISSILVANFYSYISSSKSVI